MGRPIDRHYAVLNVDPTASPEEVRKAWRDLVRVWHPDRFANDPELQKVADERLRAINEAYEALKNPQLEDELPDVSQMAATPQLGWQTKLLIIVSAFRGMAPKGLLIIGLAVCAVLFIVMLVVVSYAGSRMVLRADNAADGSFIVAAAARKARALTPRAPVLESAQIAGGGQTQEARPVENPTPRRAPRPAPDSGTELISPRGRGGSGWLAISNTTEQDAVARLTVQGAAGTPLRMVYIRARTDTTISNIGTGVYVIYVTMGQDWDAGSHRFLRKPSAAGPIGPFQFIEIDTPGETRSDHYEIVLRPQGG